jgi:hypothetical protein
MGNSDSDARDTNKTADKVRTIMATATVDTATLTMVINQCFSYAMDARLSPQDQNSFLVEGKRLRGQLLNLLSAQFDSGSPQLASANSKLTAVNTSLSQNANVLANSAQTLNNIANLVSTLDKLLSIATSFV